MTQNNNGNESQNQKIKKEQQSSQQSSSKRKRGSSNCSQVVTDSDRLAQLVRKTLVVVTIIGLKGGVGKSQLVQQIACSFPPELLKVIDGDNANQTTKLVVGKMLPVESIEVTENPDKYQILDKLVDVIAEEENPKGVVILDTPANAIPALNNWLNRGGGAETLEMVGAKVIALYVVPNDEQSVQQFVGVRQQLSVIKHWVLVKNLYGGATESDFERLMSDKTIVSTKKKFSFCEMYLPELRKPEVDLIRVKKLPFTKALESTNLCGKTRLLHFKRRFDAEFAAVLETILASS